jgi:hypothetical protein
MIVLPAPGSSALPRCPKPLIESGPPTTKSFVKHNYPCARTPFSNYTRPSSPPPKMPFASFYQYVVGSLHCRRMSALVWHGCCVMS